MRRMSFGLRSRTCRDISRRCGMACSHRTPPPSTRSARKSPGLVARPPALSRQSIAFSVDSPDGLMVDARGDEIAQIMANLLSNAVRYTPTGGNVRVEAARPSDGGVDRGANLGTR